MFVFNAPVIFAVSPAHGPTEGGSQVTVSGAGFGPAPRNTFSSNSSRVSLSDAATIPTVALRVNMHRGCVSDSYGLDGSAVASVSTCAPGSVVSHSDSSLVILSAPGIGVDRQFNVTFIEGTGAGANVISSNNIRWDFDPPTISLTDPSVMRVKDAEDTSPLTLLLAVSGTNFGTVANAKLDNWTQQEQAVSLSVNGALCDGAFRWQKGALPLIQCTIPLLPAGPHNISIGVAGQNASLASSDPVRVVERADAHVRLLIYVSYLAAERLHGRLRLELLRGRRADVPAVPHRRNVRWLRAYAAAARRTFRRPDPVAWVLQLERQHGQRVPCRHCDPGSRVVHRALRSRDRLRKL